MQRTVAVHTTWRSGATALSWAVAATYGRSFLCEPLYCPQFVIQPDPFPDGFLDRYGMVDPTEIRDRTDRLRFCPASAVSSEDVEFVVELLSFLRTTIPDVVVTDVPLRPRKPRLRGHERERVASGRSERSEEGSPRGKGPPLERFSPSMQESSPCHRNDVFG